MFGVSTKTIQRRVAEFELPTRQHDPLSDMELDTIVSEILGTFPNCGYRQMKGHLTAKGLHIQWSRITDSMRRVFPEGILMRTLGLTAVRRRVYSVRAPLSLWHIDGNHKLIR
eukprot:Seg997.11 transcript_id=Seg997.11/GoldUCD/mRNA.D3Y31 product="hypothetical protein" protein_id=Seg997.11/GoldUCD/D3Y31